MSITKGKLSIQIKQEEVEEGLDVNDLKRLFDNSFSSAETDEGRSLYKFADGCYGYIDKKGLIHFI